MSTFTLPPNMNRAFPITIPPSGQLQLYIEAEWQVTALIVDDYNLGIFRSGAAPAALWRKDNFIVAAERLTLWQGPVWHLIIINFAKDRGTAVYANMWG